MNAQALAARLGYCFADPELLGTALTHRSSGSDNNERLEFLGDSVLGLVMTEYLYQRFPQLSEGELTRIRAALVNGRSLAALGRELELGDDLLMGQGALQSGAWRRDSVLADGVEAVIGAIYLDGGLEAARARILAWFESRFADPDLGKPRKDAKTRLQEWLMARGRDLPEYRLLAETGPAHAPRFDVECLVAGAPQPVQAQGTSRRRAEQEAADQMLKALEANGSEQSTD